MVNPLRTLPRLWTMFLMLGIVAAALSGLPADWWQAHLTFGSGKSIAQAAPLIPKLWLAIAAALLLLAPLVRTFGPRFESWFVDRLSGWGVASSATWSKRRWGMISLALVLWFDWPAIIWGYFESDDFVFLANNRTESFPDLLYVVMNDHVFPLGRIWIRVCHQLFGVQAWCYSSLAVVSLAALLWSGCLVLREMKASVLAILVYLTLNIGWTMWGEFTSGEYILLAYESLMTAAMLGIWSVLRWYRTGNLIYLVTISIAILYAGLINLSGLWVACAIIVFAFFESAGRFGTIEWQQVKQRTVPLMMAVCVLVISLIGFYWHAFHRPNGPVFLSVAGERAGFTALIIQVLYIEATAWMSFLLPVPHHLSDINLMWPAMLVTLATALLFVMVSLRGQARLQQGRLLACLIVSLGVVTMVALGRPSNVIGNVVPPKYLFLPYHWLCLAVGLMSGEFVRRATSNRQLIIKAIGSFIATSWLIHGMASQLGARGVPFMDTTRGGELREHRLERAALDEIRQRLNVSLHLDQGKEIVIPDISGASLCNRYPALRFPWGQEPPLSLFVDVLAAAPEKVTFVQPDSFEQEAVSPIFFRALKQDASLAELYSDLSSPDKNGP